MHQAVIVLLVLTCGVLYVMYRYKNSKIAQDASKVEKEVGSAVDVVAEKIEKDVK